MIQELQALLGLPGLVIAVVAAFAIGGGLVSIVLGMRTSTSSWCEARDERTGSEEMGHVRKRLDEGSGRFTRRSRTGSGAHRRQARRQVMT